MHQLPTRREDPIMSTKTSRLCSRRNYGHPTPRHAASCIQLKHTRRQGTCGGIVGSRPLLPRRGEVGACGRETRRDWATEQRVHESFFPREFTHRCGFPHAHAFCSSFLLVLLLLPLILVFVRGLAHALPSANQWPRLQCPSLCRPPGSIQRLRV